MFTWLLAIVDLIFLAVSAYFAYESWREMERRAPYWGLGGTLLHLLLLGLIFWMPGIQWLIALYFLAALAALVFFSLPIPGESRSLKGALGYAAGSPEEIGRFDERDSLFARNRSLRPDGPEYEAQYARRPEKREYDEKRRQVGGPLGKPGAIDGGYQPNLAMMKAAFLMPDFLGPHAEVDPYETVSKGTYAKGGGVERADITAQKATRIVKGFAEHLGADLVGVCKTNRLWSYSHRGEIHYGEWDQWGREIPDPLPYAVVIATKMELPNVWTAPHTPTVAESSIGYAKGAYITTILAQYFGGMGYRARADHSRHYESLLVPLAVDAGLGELGRQGYLIAKNYGPAVRLFACQTDMVLVPDDPIDLGAEAFCKKCLKCAESCPSKSIPLEVEKTTERGLLRWKLDEESCFDYWGKVGTDCSVCMAVCPFTRPQSPLHQTVRWMLKRNRWAREIFPRIDNHIYGRRWRPRKALDWMEYPKGSDLKGPKN